MENWFSNAWTLVDTRRYCSRPADGLNETHDTTVPQSMLEEAQFNALSAQQAFGWAVINQMHWGLSTTQL